MNDLYVFNCSHDEDKRKMLAMTKACFDGAPMVFSPWWPNEMPQTMRFRRVKFWVRICGLPCEYLNSHMDEARGEMLGIPLEIDLKPNFVPRNDYLRINVMLNLGEPLIPGFFLKLGDDSIIWIQLRYEHLFKYCTRCGRIGHKYTRCTRHEDLIKQDINHKMMEYLSQGILTMETEEGFSMFSLDMRATPSSERTITTRARLIEEPDRPPSPNFRASDILVDFDLGIQNGGRTVQLGQVFNRMGAPFRGPMMGEAGGSFQTNPQNAPVAMEVEQGGEGLQEEQGEIAAPVANQQINSMGGDPYQDAAAAD